MDIDLPLSIKLGRKNYALNLNFYRNAHYQILNKLKVTFGSLVQEKIAQLPRYQSVSLTYTLFPRTHRLCDVSNICTVVDKFFCDALVNQGKLEDDNYNFVSNIQYRFGSIDKDNPRVTVTIEGKEYADYPYPERNQECG